MNRGAVCTLVQKACEESELTTNELRLPDVTLWIDPLEVCARWVNWLGSMRRGNGWQRQMSNNVKASRDCAKTHTQLASSVAFFNCLQRGKLRVSCARATIVCSSLQVRREQQALHDSVFRRGRKGRGEGRPGWLRKPRNLRLSLGHIFRLRLRGIQWHRRGGQRWREGRWQERAHQKRARGRPPHRYHGTQDSEATREESR